jgi:hypothetical protein
MTVAIGFEGSANKVGVGIVRDGVVLSNPRWGWDDFVCVWGATRSLTKSRPRTPDLSLPPSLTQTGCVPTHPLLHAVLSFCSHVPVYGHGKP